ncbi:baseplate wedge subunit [Aeromonas phage AS-gz]|uniref:Baseplate wedge protein gp6 n=3 Tax=Tulanevirus TaxID=2560244 RepID=A0A898K8H0_9CAUD|nr:baseplate wedge subunit [Aeromonas phage AS-gz]YP_010095751.1 baseplate wedge subunit [Aeromonas phage 60AhydR15PP]QSJ03530.1 baseplate wedge subunit [Aeromonas phage vB_AsM_ZHF]UIW13055.1 baseplate wedge subunit [Aeromonas phage AhMtk13a]ASU00770.1 baseplate wedge subunit [Aeromonas phage AS-gz]AWH15547.1 baseplate wedge subunit [Aeromonas phage 60AhydR15PP]
MKLKTNIPDIFKGATFDEIKSDLIDWLGNQDEFKDYDFTGSRLNVLTDLLAYCTLYIQQFSNSALFESFIRTAVLRSSVVQHAQDMGYMPDSRTASSTTLLLKATNPLNPTSIRIPRGTKFVGTVERTDNYPFVTLDDVTIIRGQNNTYESLVNVYQGRIVRTELKFDGISQILIRDPNIDRSKVRVWVDGSPWVDWTNNSMVDISGASNVFYMRETVDQTTEIFFGEGEASTEIAGGALVANYIGGLKPNIGSTIVIEYLSTRGEPANGSRDFAYTDTLQNIVITDLIENPTDDADYVGTQGGGDPEDIERIRELAPVMRESQRRCVTATDYESFVSHKFGSVVQAVQCFTDSEKRGYAFIAIKPKQGLRLTTVQKEDIENYLSQYNLAPITPAVIDPNYMYIKSKIKVTYNLSELYNSEEWLRGQIIDSIDRYYTDEVEIFNKNFSKSKMLTRVDSSDDSIIGSSAEISLVREADNFFKTPMAGISFHNAISKGSVNSSTINFTKNNVTYEVNYVSTSQTGKILIGPFADGDIPASEYSGNDFTKTTVGGRNKYYEVGTVDYALSVINFDLGILPVPAESFAGAYIEIEALPVDDTIFAKDGTLIVFENDLRQQYTAITLEAISQ